MALEQTERGIGLELIEREVSKILWSDLNTEIELQQAKWDERDQEWNSLTGQEPDFVQLETIEPENFYQGHRPSLVKDAAITKFPNVSIMAYQARPNTSIIDQATNYIIGVDIELFVKAYTEYESNARTHRTVEAIHQVLTRKEKLNGLSFGWENDPIVQITDIMSRKENIGSGEDMFWQGARIRYNLSRHSRLPQ